MWFREIKTCISKKSIWKRHEGDSKEDHFMVNCLVLSVCVWPQCVQHSTWRHSRYWRQNSRAWLYLHVKQSAVGFGNVPPQAKLLKKSWNEFTGFMWTSFKNFFAERIGDAEVLQIPGKSENCPPDQEHPDTVWVSTVCCIDSLINWKTYCKVRLYFCFYF